LQKRGSRRAPGNADRIHGGRVRGETGKREVAQGERQGWQQQVGGGEEVVVAGRLRMATKQHAQATAAECNGIEKRTAEMVCGVENATAGAAPLGETVTAGGVVRVCRIDQTTGASRRSVPPAPFREQKRRCGRGRYPGRQAFARQVKPSQPRV